MDDALRILLARDTRDAFDDYMLSQIIADEFTHV